ncbi:MAG: hypothetical protein ACOCTI_00735 [Phycisphaeraceae bacterium]
MQGVAVAVALAGVMTTGLESAAAQTDSLNTFMIGNSLTDQQNPEVAFDRIAGGRGDNWNVEAFTVAGETLDRHWYIHHQQDGAIDPLVNQRTWDTVSLQPYGRHLVDPKAPRDDVSPDWGTLNAAKRFTDYFRSKNPDTTIYIYQSWARPGNGSFESFDYKSAWDSAYTDPASWDWDKRDFFGQLMDGLRASKGGDADSPIHMVPLGDVYYEINERMHAGQFGQYSDIKQWLADGVHMGWGLPQYTKAATFYATMFGEKPDGLDWTVYDGLDIIPRPDLSREQQLEDYVEIDQEMVDLVNDAVWDVVAGHEYSGVVPEPASLSLLAVPAGLLLVRHRRGH